VSKGAAVIVVQEAFGVNSHIKDVTRRFASLGYRAMAPHLFHRLDRTIVSYDDPSFVELVEQLDDDEILVDIDATISHLNSSGLDNDRIAIVGFCMGGRVSFLVAANRRLSTAVGYYGGGIAVSRRLNLPALIDRASGLLAPWLGIFGEADPNIPVEEVEALRLALAHAQVETEVISYPEAGHGFNCDDRAAHHPEAAAAAWSRTVDWLSRGLGM
jgi:carboxymethylenebutenolidase